MALARIERKATSETRDRVIFLHGFGGCAQQWRGLMRRVYGFAQATAFDLPGHAGSLGSGVKPTPKAMAEALNAELADSDERLHIVGHSMGGAVASLMAILAPDRYDGLLLLAPGGFGEGIAHDRLKRWASARTEAEISAVLPDFFGPGFPIDPRIAPMHANIRAVESQIETLRSIAERLAVDGKQGTLPIDALMKSRSRISVIWGALDKILPVEQAVNLAPWAGNNRIGLHVLNGVGHSPAEEAPTIVEAVTKRMIEV